jgi:hypothetical protein
MGKKLIVTSDIPFGSVYAYRAGDQIDEDAVKENKWEDYVASPTSKEAKQALGTVESADQEKGK